VDRADVKVFFERVSVQWDQMRTKPVPVPTSITAESRPAVVRCARASMTSAL
jgi:hypothetical protein